MQDDIVKTLRHANLGSTEAFAAAIYACLEETPVRGDRNEHPVAILARAFSSPELADLSLRIREALAFGARTWTPPAAKGELCLSIALLFKRHSSPALAVDVAKRLLGGAPYCEALSDLSANADLLVEAVLGSANDETVKGWLVQLCHPVRLRRFAVSILLRLIKDDVSLVPTVIDRVLDVAKHYPVIDARPSYMVGFDDEMNLQRIRATLAQLRPDQAIQFQQQFLSHSRRFIQSTRALPILDEELLAPPSLIVLEDQVQGGDLAPPHQAALKLGAYRHFRTSSKSSALSEMKALGLQELEILAA